MTTFTHKGSYSHVPGYAEINFQQGLDGDGWELDLTATGGRNAARLLYRRGNEWATVPNMPYNQPAVWRIDALRWQADRADERANRLEADPFPKAWDASTIRSARAMATRLREDADELERTGNGRTIANA